MEELYGWVRNITGYLLFLAVLDNLIPKKSYQKYIRLFAGMVAILLILGPLTGGVRLEERIARFYETLTFQYEAKELKKEILGMEQKRLGEIISQYERAVAEDIRQMAEDTGFTVYECQAEIGKEEKDEQFGKVVRIRMKVRFENRGEDGAGEEWNETGRERSEAGKEWSEPVSIGSAEPVEPVVIGEKNGAKREEISQESSRENRRRQQAAEKGAVGKLRRKIGAYYGLEEAYVEIQVIEGEG